MVQFLITFSAKSGLFLLNKEESQKEKKEKKGSWNFKGRIQGAELIPEPSCLP